jgi:glycosyltransferase involved in cell wall biosynthesis
VDLSAELSLCESSRMMKKSTCIISFSPIARDGRVLRQIEYLSTDYDVTVIGLGEPPEPGVLSARLEWRRLPEGSDESRWRRSLSTRVKSRLISAAIPALNMLRLPGLLRRAAYERWYWNGLWQRAALAFALEAGCDAYHANDWTALPVAAEAASRHGARLIFDAHEYAPLELENRWLWGVRYQSAVTYFLRKYASQVDAFTTVCEPIGRRYQQEFGLKPTIVYNVPKRVDLPERRTDLASIRLVHHGAAFRDRRLEKMILTLTACDSRFSLHFILVPGHAGYVEELETLVRRLAPGRVEFHPPVPPHQTVQAVAKYDVGFCLIEPSNYNYRMAAPNKFFDYIAAGMPICIGPSPAMVEVVKRYDLGCVAPSFEPGDVAATLNALDGSRLTAMQQGARRAAADFHADAEMAKLLELYRALLADERRKKTSVGVPNGLVALRQEAHGSQSSEVPHRCGS